MRRRSRRYLGASFVLVLLGFLIEDEAGGGSGDEAWGAGSQHRQGSDCPRTGNDHKQGSYRPRTGKLESDAIGPQIRTFRIAVRSGQFP